MGILHSNERNYVSIFKIQTWRKTETSETNPKTTEGLKW